MTRLFGSSLALVCVVVASPASATYSIVATDSATRQVGGAVTSCVGTIGVDIVYRPSPGYGGVNAQASPNTEARDRAVELLRMGVAPDSIISQITAQAFDSNIAQRQYGIADLQGRAAGYTGSSAPAYKAHRPGTLGTFTYSVQGNTLTGVGVIDQAESAFRTKGCDLADKLMLALEAGAENAQGDNRCTPLGIPSDAAGIEVNLAGGTGTYLKLGVAYSKKHPLPELRRQFDEWRKTHPCSVADGGLPDGSTGTPDASADASRADGAGGGARDGGNDGTAGGGGAGAGIGGGSTGGSAGIGGGAGTSTAGTGGSAGTGGTITGGSAGTSGTAGTSTAGTGGATGTSGGTGGRGGTSGTGGAGGKGDDDGGCSCRVNGASGARSNGAIALALFAAALGARRRRAVLASSIAPTARR